jgi:hypothetical protein
VQVTPVPDPQFPSGAPLGSPSSQAQALANPTPVTSETPVNPGQADALSRAQNYESNVAKGTNEETVRELGRQRDEISVGMQREGNAAMARGADPSLFRSRAMASGARDLSNLQGRLADVSLGRRAEAVGLVGGRADSAASEQRLTNFNSISSQLEANRDQVARAEAQARLEQAPYDRLSGMLQNVGQYRDSFAGLTGGGGGFATPPQPTQPGVRGALDTNWTGASTITRPTMPGARGVLGGGYSSSPFPSV